jgi:hypothetical protein
VAGPDQPGWLGRSDRSGGTAVRTYRGEPSPSPIVSWTLRLATAAALGIDAVVHASDASGYDAVKATISQGQLFRLEAAVAIAAGLLVLIRPRPSSWIIAFLVAASALATVLVYRYVDVGQLGPIPDMYENTWSVPGKLLSVYAEGAAVVLSVLGLIAHRKRQASMHR